MKYIISLFLSGILVIVTVLNIYIDVNSSNDDMKLGKLQTQLAQGEIIVGPLCYSYTTICSVWDDGTFLKGVPYQ